jgi:hypothetical protein
MPLWTICKASQQGKLQAVADKTGSGAVELYRLQFKAA